MTTVTDVESYLALTHAALQEAGYPELLKIVHAGCDEGDGTGIVYSRPFWMTDEDEAAITKACALASVSLNRAIDRDWVCVRCRVAKQNDLCTKLYPVDILNNKSCEKWGD